MAKTANIKETLIKAGKLLAWVIVIWLILMIAVQVALSSGVAEKLISKYAAEYIDGTTSLGKLNVSVFRHFPNISLSADDFNITYPADRFDTMESEGPQSPLSRKGQGTECDTLAAFDRLAVSIDVLSLARGKISIPYAELTAPRIYAHRYSNGQANWDILLPSSGDDPAVERDEETSGGIPEIKFGHIGMSGHPHIVYTDSKDTLFAAADLKQVRLSGRLTPGRNARNKLGIYLDSLFVAGRTSRDTLAFGMDHFSISENRRAFQINASANTMIASEMTGRIRIPVKIDGAFGFPRSKEPGLNIYKLNADIASIPINGTAALKFRNDGLDIKGKIQVQECRIQELMDNFLKQHIHGLDAITTDAAVSMNIDCNGSYNYSDSSLPEITASISIPDSKISVKGVDNPVQLKFEATADASGGKVGVAIDQLHAACNGLDLNVTAGVTDIMVNDPEISMDGSLNIDLADLKTFIPDTMDVTAHGQLNARVKGRMKASHLDIYSFSHADIDGEISGDSIIFAAPSDSIDIRVEKLDVKLGPEARASRKDSSKIFHMMTIKGQIGNLIASYGTIGLRGKELSLSAMNSADQQDTLSVGILGGRINAERLIVRDTYGTALQLKDSRNSFQMLPKKDRPDLPVLTFTSKNGRIALKEGENRAMLADAEIRATAMMNTVERRQRVKVFMDSIARQYPDVPRDSLMIHLRTQAQKREVPDWLQEEDFKKQDIDVKLDETLAKYFREWDMKGSLGIGSGMMMTPYFPIRNILRGFDIKFDNDKIQIDSLLITSGESEIGAKGKLTGLSRALLGRGNLNLDMDIYSGKVNADELFAAFSAGSTYTPQTQQANAPEINEDELFEMTQVDTIAIEDVTTPLIVIPSNLNAEIRLDMSGITYSDLSISKLKSKMIMKERCVQISGTEATSNAGNIDFEGFYSTRTKKDIKAGFSFNFKNITAEKVIGLVPAVDTLMPLLKSFNGQLSCELAATAGIDTTMNVIPSSINGIIRIGGQNLSIKESEMFRSLARKLLFKNKREGYIDEMSVEGIIADSMIEVFPFVVKMDRYTLALSGIQRMDESFMYHASIIKSPFLFKLGIDVYGDNFDNMKFKIGKAKYKTTDVPVFSAVIDTTKFNLVNSIRGIFEKGVEAAVSENERRDAIEKHKKEIGYIRAVDQKLEELSEDEQKEMETQEAVMKETEEAEAKLAEAIRQLSTNSQTDTTKTKTENK